MKTIPEKRIEKVESASEIAPSKTASPSSPSARRLWKDPVEVNGRRVYRRDDLFDPQRLDDNRLTNAQRMQQGKAPIGFDDEPVNLHHLTGDEPGNIAEVGGAATRKSQRRMGSKKELQLPQT